MKKKLAFIILSLIVCVAHAETIVVKSPDGKLSVELSVNGTANYKVSYDGISILSSSPLGFTSNIGDYSSSIEYVSSEEGSIDERYELDRIKSAYNHYVANSLKLNLKNGKGQVFSVLFQVSNNDIAFRYEISRHRDTGSIRILEESTGFRFPSGTTTFLTPQSDAMIGWKRTKPSYEEEYVLDSPMDVRSQYGHGYTFPCLFKIDGGNAWVLLSETGVDSRYCGSHLSDHQGDGLYQIAFPMSEENNGNGSAEPGLSLPCVTPWRTITVGTTLAPIVETTIPFDVVKPRYESSHHYEYGKGTWSWIVWQDNSINYNDQVHYINLAKQMGFKYVLIDNYWDTNIGKENMERLVSFAKSQGVDVFLWYSSSGYWNDIVQGPTNMMDNSITRKACMKWMESIGVKGIKVDFFGGDKQETMRLYEEILSDADDHGLMVIFHGCTLPRGWERMYPNYVGSEAVLASENMVFQQHFCDLESQNASLHPFIRNAVGCMEFGGCFMNRFLSKGNKRGSQRRSTDCMELATTILFQNPIQNFALAPENLEDESEGGAPKESMDFLRKVPTTWEETRFIDGYPGKYIVLARKHHSRWYIAGVNGTGSELKLTLNLSEFISKGSHVELYTDNLNNQDPSYDNSKTINKPESFNVTMDKDGGFVLIN